MKNETPQPQRDAAPANRSSSQGRKSESKSKAAGAQAAERPSPRTPRNDKQRPAPGVDGRHDLDSPAYFLNRELTWLNFNFRVLSEAEDPRTPLLERVKFVAIVSSNLDEFFMKRIGGLKQQQAAGISTLTSDGLSPTQQIEASHEVIRQLEQRKRKVLADLLLELAESGILIRSFEDLKSEHKAELRQFYLKNVYPLVTPQATDPAHPFPFVSNLSLNLLVALHYPDDPTPSLARVKIPIGSGVPRFLSLKGTRTYVPIESVIANNLELLFPGMKVDSTSMFRVTRNADTERDEESADDLLALIESEVRDRRFAPIVRLEVSPMMANDHRSMLAAELELDQRADVFEVEGMLGMDDLMELMRLPLPELKYEPHRPTDHPSLTTDKNIFSSITDAGSILLHHPYVSFKTTVERFLRESSRDPKVRAIKMSLYRTSSSSKVIEYLIDAARNGKQVAVVVELKARFDEAANIRWASRLEEAGVHVTFGVMGLKTHCKVILVVRLDRDGLSRYAHVGTGNYHEGTAKLYSDFGMLTADNAIGSDLTELFNYLTTGYKPKRHFLKILPAPKILRSALIAKIEREIALHSKETPGLIQFKMNALEDVEMTRALYRASQAGVHVDLIIRDSCRLRPGLPGVSENIRVISIVGRFLEHARIYHFGNGGRPEYYIGSADSMKRNLTSRVEVVAPVEDEVLQEEIRFFLDVQLKDDRSAWDMQPDGSYIQRQPKKSKSGEEVLGSQEQLIRWHEDRLKEANRLRRRRPNLLQRPSFDS